MQRSTHASLGASTLGPTPPAQAWGDAFRSIELVGSTTMADATAASAAADVSLDEPIEAARAWLSDPARRRILGATIVARAEQTLDVATEHLRELDLLAGEVALEANESGAIDPIRLERVDMMATMMRAYSERMRSLLDPGALEPRDAEHRLDVALDAARGGGLPALVAAL